MSEQAVAAKADMEAIRPINVVTWKDKFAAYKKRPLSMFLLIAFLMTALSLLIAVPIGICSAIYLVEYAKRGNKLVSVVRITTETLSGIPSIVYGLFGYLMFVIAFGWGLSFFGGALTLSIMVLPTIMRTTEEALLSVPDSYREGSFGLGAGRLRTIFKVVLPSAVPGILSGVILAIGRIVGETAALIFTSGTTAEIPKSLFDSGCTLAVHMYKLLSEGLYTKQAYATAVVLLVMVVIINATFRKYICYLLPYSSFACQKTPGKISTGIWRKKWVISKSRTWIYTTAISMR